jgi:hypothetical protein
MMLGDDDGSVEARARHWGKEKACGWVRKRCGKVYAVNCWNCWAVEADVPGHYKRIIPASCIVAVSLLIFERASLHVPIALAHVPLFTPHTPPSHTTTTGA